MIEELIKNKVLIVVRHLSLQEAIDLCHILLEKEFRFVEVSFSQEKADEILKGLKNHFDRKICLGAGTIFQEQDYRRALNCGADYVLSPGLSLKIAELSKKDEIPYIPGVFTPTDVQNAVEMGFELLKLYPADLGLLRSYTGPFPKVKFMPFGGVTDQNIVSYLSSGASAVGIGSYIANKEILSNKDFAQLSKRVCRIKELIGDVDGPLY